MGLEIRKGEIRVRTKQMAAKMQPLRYLVLIDFMMKGI
jgi:hypothetical protein